MNRETEILQLVNEFPLLSNKEIGKKLGINKSTVTYYLHKNNIYRDRKLLQKFNNTNRNTDIIITERCKEIFIGTLLGDSSITKYRRNVESIKILNSRITCGHSLKQKEYVLYLKQLLEIEGMKMNYTETNRIFNSNIEGRLITTYGRCDLSTSRNIEFNNWRNVWYPNNVKIIPKNIENYFTPLCIAIWFMDDGSKNNSSYYLHTEGFVLEDINYLKNLLFTKYNIETVIHTNREKNLLYVKAKSKKLFTTIIYPYICNSMKYKLFDLNIGSE